MPSTGQNKRTYDAKVENGELKIDYKSRFYSELKHWDGKKVIVTIEKKRKKRSPNQNQYYWGVVIDMVTERLNDLGHQVNATEVHEAMKTRFSKEMIFVKDQPIIVPQSTTAKSTVEFMEYMDEIKQFAAETLDINIPDPNE